ncbi:MAG: class I SAM-dependent methyltransferase [Chitinivibrionales bacterium]|nr:class I SAM-dependent methyltransferase [Chitinivibrionales bacterium]
MDIKNDPTTIEFTIKTCAGSVSFIRPRDADEILNQLSDEEFEKDELMPYWAEHWPASEVMIQNLCSNNYLRKCTSICELGCGLGTLSATIASLGLKSVATDISHRGCRFASENIKRYTDKDLVVCCDWRHSPFLQKFDCIVGCDILYEKRWIKPIVDFLRNTLVSKGKAVLCDPGRPYWNLFKTEVLSQGFVVEKIDTILASNNMTIVEILHLYLK